MDDLLKRADEALKDVTPGPWRVVIDDDGNPPKGTPDMKKFTYKDLRTMVEGDICRWSDLMKAHGCSGDGFDVAKRIMGGIVLDDWNSRLSDADKLSVLLKLIFDAGLHAGLSAKCRRNGGE